MALKQIWAYNRLLQQHEHLVLLCWTRAQTALAHVYKSIDWLRMYILLPSPSMSPYCRGPMLLGNVSMLTWTLSSMLLLCQLLRRFCDTAGCGSPLPPKHLRHRWLLPLSLQTPGFALTGLAVVLWHSSHPAHHIPKASTHADEVTVCVEACSGQALCASALS